MDACTAGGDAVAVAAAAWSRSRQCLGHGRLAKPETRDHEQPKLDGSGSLQLEWNQVRRFRQCGVAEGTRIRIDGDCHARHQSADAVAVSGAELQRLHRRDAVACRSGQSAVRLP